MRTRTKPLLDRPGAPRRWIKTNPAGWFGYEAPQCSRNGRSWSKVALIAWPCWQRDFRPRACLPWWELPLALRGCCGQPHRSEALCSRLTPTMVGRPRWSGLPSSSGRQDSPSCSVHHRMISGARIGTSAGAGSAHRHYGHCTRLLHHRLPLCKKGGYPAMISAGRTHDPAAPGAALLPCECCFV